MNQISKTERLAWILVALISFAFCIALYFALTDWQNSEINEFANFIKGLLPEFIGALASILVTYLLAIKLGVKVNQIIGEDYEELPIIIYKNYHDENLPWDELFDKSKNVVIVVMYFRTWIQQHRKSLEKFFKNGGQLKVIQSNPENNIIIDEYVERLANSSYTNESIKVRITDTGKDLEKIFNTNRSPKSKLEVYYFDYTLNYFVAKFDSNHIVYSSFEHHIYDKVNSPNILINCKKAPDFVLTYWEKEINGVENVGGLIQNSTLQSYGQ